MKKSAIDLEEFRTELLESGIPATLDYDTDEEAYVLNVGDPIADGIYKGKSTLQIAPGFLYDRSSESTPQASRILAYADRIIVFTPNGNLAEPKSAGERVVFDKLTEFINRECEEIVYSIR